MRNVLIPTDAPQVSYGIREIVSKGFELQRLGKNVIWENIGDPVQKGMKLPAWIKEIITEAVQDDAAYGYCDSKGLPDTRTFLAERTNKLNGCTIDADDITFFNGLGDAIARVYSLLSRKNRVLLPSPTYPAHSGAESIRIGAKPVSYPLHPDRNWMPDPDEVRRIVAANPDICAILIINPDNPTGTVFSRKLLVELVNIAREFDLFVICDEIYENLVYEGEMTRLAEVIGDVPGIAMKGISKEIPWPGSRCGWLEYYNRDKDPDFDALCRKIDHCKMTEVCSTTLPQKVIPSVMSDDRYYTFLRDRNIRLAEKMNMIREMTSRIDGVYCNGGGGAFYATLHFDKPSSSSAGVTFFSSRQKECYYRWNSPNTRTDLKLVHYLLAGYNLCSVPLSGFNTDISGIRITLLEDNPVAFNYMLDQLERGLTSRFHPAGIIMAG